jgi:uncharacterized protein YabN with tetrapyrrole methylase and pyrophosphatase domain
VVLASALDRHSFSTLRPVLLVLDSEPDMALLRKHYGDALKLEKIGTRHAALPAVSPIVDLSSVAAVTRIAEWLRAEDGCPWDKEQTHASLRPHLLEEAYEALEALDSGDLDRLRDELGDLLFQIAIHAQLAHEEGAFDMSDVARRIGEKLVRRHPHVFAGTEIQGDLLAQWERIKRQERDAGGKNGEGIVSGVPKDLPALFAAERLQERAARVGLQPARIDLPLDVDDAAFLGELLFDLVALAREKGFDAETALREANERFTQRVGALEARARKDGRALESYAPAELRRMWDEGALPPQAGDEA